MKPKILMMVIICLSFLVSCDNSNQTKTIEEVFSKKIVEANNSNVTSKHNVESNTKASTNIDKKSVKESWDIVSHSTVMLEICHIDSLVFVGKDSIKPKNLEALNGNNEVSEEVIKSFIERNETSVKFSHLFDVYAKVKYVKIKETIETTLNDLVKSSPKFDQLVLFSQVGSTSDGSQSLIYFETYNHSGEIRKQFCLIIREKEGAGKKVRFIDA